MMADDWEREKLEELRAEMAALEQRMKEYQHIINAQSHLNSLAAHRRRVAEKINEHLNTFVRAKPGLYDCWTTESPEPSGATESALRYHPGFGLGPL